MDVQQVINCTGSNANYWTVTDPLINNLLKRGLARPDRLQLGLDSKTTGSLRNNSDMASNVLCTIGPTLKGTLWEATAVPEIRRQAVVLATTLLTTVASN